MLEKEIKRITDPHIARGVRRIVKKYEDWYKEYPCSISGKYHKHEPTMEIHIERVVKVAIELSGAFNLTEHERDILIAACVLHDVGNALINRKGKQEGWHYFEATGWSRKEGNGEEHPLLSSVVIARNLFPYCREIQDLVECHMDHWYEHVCRKAVTKLEYCMVISDYLASRDYITIKED